MKFRFVLLPPQTERTHELAIEIGRAVPEAEVLSPQTVEDALDCAATADAAFGTPTPAILHRASKLRWLQAPQAAPPAGYYFPELIAHPVVVTNLRGIFADRIPAHIVAYLLVFARGLHVYMERQRARLWDDDQPAPVVHLPDATALIVGVGSIGAETARLCAALRMRVVGIDPRETTPPPGVSELHPPEWLDTLLPRADFVIATVPHTPKTEGLFNRSRFERMKRTAFFINIGRGRTTKLDDLSRALREGVIAGAGLDVYEIEPLPQDHSLWSAPNVVLTPHVAAAGPSLDPARTHVVVENAKRFAAGQPLLNVVDKAEWY